MSIFGYQPAAMIASPLFYQTLIHPDDVPRVPAIADRDGRRGKLIPRKNQFRIRSADGAYLWLECRYTPIRDAGGRLLEIEGLLTDITERKKDADKISLLATTDLVTQLPSRASFIDRAPATLSPRRGAARLPSPSSTSTSTGSRISMTRSGILRAT